MRKTINLFSRVLCALVLCIGLVVTGCYDDSALQTQLKDHESRLIELERLTAQQNTNIESLQTIVNALQERDYVTSIAPIKEGQTETGYIVTFNKFGAVTIHNGKEAYVPAIGVKQDTDGQWYWTVDGDWLTDSNGDKVRASAKDGEDGDSGEAGVTPQLKIEEGYWYVSYDGGKTWGDEPLGQATSDKGNCIFTAVSYDDDYLYLTMADGQKFTIPRATSNQGESGEGDGEVGPVKFELSEITASTVTFTGTVTDVDAITYIEKIVVYYMEAYETFSIISAQQVSTSKISSDNTVSITISRLAYNTRYKYCLYVKCRGEGNYSDVQELTTYDVTGTDLSINSSANCYIVSEAGTYIFKLTKGNSSTSVGAVASADVLWESFGTGVHPSVGDLIKSVYWNKDFVAFETVSNFTEGNAVVAVRDVSGKILWSWHIWLTDQPQGQVYYNNAGTMMDRNLGATSATPGDVGALGLLYQWGRKDPFLGWGNSFATGTAESTITWPSAVKSSPLTGTIDYVTANPTTPVTATDSYSDWYYTGSSSIDDTRWQSSKTIYDPCPPGWRVPDGGNNGVWSKALGSSLYFTDEELYDSTNAGMNFSGKFGDYSIIWYPASGGRGPTNGELGYVGRYGYYWSVTPYDAGAYLLHFYYDGYVYPSNHYYRTSGFSVRCLQVTD